jgi:peroxiredoxin
MSKVQLNSAAPDFKLANFKGEAVKLSNFKGKQHVLLVFNRGFV